MSANQVTAAELAEALRGFLECGDPYCANKLLERYDAQQAEKQACTVFSAVWCPRCGDCTCDLNVYGERDLCTSSCRLHGTPMVSRHAESERYGRVRLKEGVWIAEEADPVRTEIEAAALNVVRAHEHVVSVDMSIAFYKASAERSAAIEALGEALRKRGAL
jgi:hypothetical protein